MAMTFQYAPFATASFLALAVALGGCGASPDEATDESNQALGAAGLYQPKAPTGCHAFVDCNGLQRTSCDSTTGRFALQSFGLWQWQTVTQTTASSQALTFWSGSLAYFRVCSEDALGNISWCTAAIVPSQAQNCPAPPPDPSTGAGGDGSSGPGKQRT